MGKGGNINIQAGAFTLSDGAQIQTAVNSDFETLPGGRGNAGNVNVDVRGAVSITGRKGGIPSAILSSVGTGATGNGGDIKIKSGSFDMSDDARLNTTTLGQGNAGSVFIQASDAVSLANAYIFTPTKAAPGTIANGGAINIQARNLSLTKGSSLFASTGGQGNAGNISLQVADSVSLSSKSTIFSAMASGAVGNGGNIDVQAGSLSLTDESSISASNILGKGNAGNISINTVNNVSINGGAFVSSATGGQGNAGKVAIRAGGAVSIAGRGENTPSSVYNTVVDSGVGNGGDIEIHSRSFSLSDGAELSTTTLGKGDAGNVQINASNDITFTSGGQITAETLGQGNAGNVTLTAGSAASFDGVGANGRRSGIFTNVGADSGLVGKGQGGNISITAPNLSITNFTAVSSSSQGQGNAGDITINSGSVRLDNRGTIAALTNSGNGGNINLTAADFLLLRRNSSISTTAGLTQSGGDGGNITIHTPFIVALPQENSHISANAYTGKGGNVSISAQGIFGTQTRSQPTLSSDITASSQLGVQGQIAITQPEVQPTQGLVELPGIVLDASNQIAQTCPKGTAARPLGEFVVSGRGSLPPNPMEPLAGTPNLSPLATLAQSRASAQPIISPTPETTLSAAPPALVEAQGWIKDSLGRIVLVASAPEVTPSTRPTATVCPAPRP